MAQKWIINENRLILGNVQYHRDLTTNHKTTLGGGLWYYDRTLNTLFLYGQSFDFGKVSKQSLINAKKDCLIRIAGGEFVLADEINIAFSTCDELEEAQLESEIIQQIK